MRSFYLITVAMIFAVFFNDHVAYLEPLSATKVIFKIFSCLTIIFYQLLFVMGIDIIALMH